MVNQPAAHVVGGLWKRIPLVVRAIVVGIVVAEIGIAPSFLVMAKPSVVTLFVLVACLGVYALFASGRLFWPATKAARRESFRETSLSAATWKWGLAGAGLFVVAIEALIFTLFRLTPYPVDQFVPPSSLTGIPTWGLWLLVVAASLSAGLCEETGFRGYIQRPLELRYGPVVAIATSTAAFALMHSNKAWVLTLMPPILLAGIMLGALAYAARSLIPGIIGHAAMDVINFSYWWWQIVGHYDRQTIFETGVDFDFLFWIATLVLSLVLFVGTIRKMLALNRQNLALLSPNERRTGQLDADSGRAPADSGSVSRLPEAVLPARIAMEDPI